MSTDPASVVEASSTASSGGTSNADSLPRNQASSSSSSPTPQTVSGAETKEVKPAEKTISCVSCRKRKLKCDRVKPKCGTCTRLRHECEFPERRRNLGSKRRNMKELEARLAEVETKLVAEVNSQKALKENTQIEPEWNIDGMDINMGEGLLDPNFDVDQFNFELQNMAPTMPVDDFSSQELISLGLHEPLPPQEMMDELHEIYFNKYHATMPMLHKYRYLASLDRAPHQRPPVCLRYAIWTMAASLSDKYSCYEDILYERSRRYLQEAEMKGFGEAFVDIYHAQTWGIIATYEAKKTYFSRSWMSTGRITRMCHMLGLHRLDGDGSDVKQILAPPRDFIELEERRRCFWGAFYCDRWASSGTGWPMSIDEKEIMTNLPASEEAFETGVAQPTISLAAALTPDGASKVTPFGGVILSATLFGHNFQHLHRTGPNERPDDHSYGEFWKRHRKMDNVLSNTFMFLPEHLRMPGGIRDMNVVFLHMNIHASSICLHQAAVLTAERYNLDQSIIHQSRARCLMAAEEITNLMRLICHVDPSNMNSWLGFCLYVAGGVMLQDSKRNPSNTELPTNLEFLLAAMKAVGIRHSITKHFTAQLEIDMEASVVPSYEPGSCATPAIPTPSMPRQHIVPLSGLIPERSNAPMTVEEMQKLGTAAGRHQSSPKNNASSPRNKASPLSDSHWDTNWQLTYGAAGRGSISNHATSDTHDLGPRNHALPPMTPLHNINNDLFKPSCPFDVMDAAAPNNPLAQAANANFKSQPTPTYNPKSSNIMQFPFRQGKYINNEGSWPADPALFYSPPPEWTPDQDGLAKLGNQDGNGNMSGNMNANGNGNSNRESGVQNPIEIGDQNYMDALLDHINWDQSTPRPGN
ncbi:fungal-specific transcription factor [Halenospora varia]|nr:fungal-specific transcription factor [Halenospora varia]